MEPVTARGLVVKNYGENIASQAEDVAKQHGLDFGAVMTAVIRHGTWVFFMVNKYGPQIVEDINSHFGR